MRQACDDDLDDIFKFIETGVPHKQMSPVITIKDYNTPRLRDLNVNDFYLAIEGGEIIGVVACWDQAKFRQTHVESYSRVLRLFKPLYNLLSGFTPLKPLPDTGDKIPYFYLAFITIRENDPEVFTALLRYLYNDRLGKEWSYFIVGLHERDPLVEALNEYHKVDVAGRLYLVHYPEDKQYCDHLDSRVPYVEISMI